MQRRRRDRRRFRAALLAPLLLLANGVERVKQTPEPIAAKLLTDRAPGSPPRAFDAPDQAFEYHRQKRVGALEDFDFQGAYRQAERALAAMPQLFAATGGIGARRARAASWEWLGPGNIGGRTRTLVIHPGKPKIMYAGGVSGGVWKSRNRGKQWTPVGDSLANLAVNALAMDPTDPDVLYAGTGEGYFREAVRGTSLPLRGGGIFQTTDGGESWQLLASTGKKAFQWVNDIVVSPLDNRRLYAATRKGVYRSTNAGKRWKRVLKSRAWGGCLDLAMASAAGTDTLFASCGTLDQATVFRNQRAESSRDWQAVLSEPGMGRTSLAIAPSDPSVVYALSASNVPGPDGRFEQALHAVFRSTEGGVADSWRARLRNTGGRKIDRVILHNPIIAFLEECGFEGANDFFAMGWYVNVIAVDPRSSERVWVGGVDLFRSDDGGASFKPATYWWSRGTPNFVHADHHGLVFHPKNGKRLYGLNDGGIYELRNPRTALPDGPGTVCTPGSNAGRWRELNNNYGVTQFYHGTPSPDGRSFVAGAQDNGTILGGDPFGINGGRRILGGDGGYTAIAFDSPRTIYATIQNGLIFRSDDGGASFEEATTGLADLATNDAGDFRAVGANFLFIAPLAMDPNDSATLWSGGRRLWRTKNGAVNWSAASAILSGGEKVSAIAVAPGDSGRVAVGTDDGRVLVDLDAEDAMTDTEWSGSRLRSGFVSSVAFDPNDTETLYATIATFGGEHVWRSEDGGANWSAVDGVGAGALPDLPVHAIEVDPADSNRLFLGTDLGVFVSESRGETWAVESSGLPAVVTESIRLIETPTGERLLFAFTHGRGAWRLALDG